MKHTKFYITMLIVVMAGLSVDLITKTVFTNQTLPVIDGVVSIFFTWNTGAGWSILSNHTLFLTILSAILVAAMIFVAIKFRPKSWVFTIGFALVFAGALGNLVDRIFFGAVRDFICLEFINFPIFNFADVFLTVGGVMLAIWLVFLYQKKEKPSDGK